MAFTRLLSQRVSYALHALCYIACKPESSVATVRELAAWMQGIWSGVSERYLAEVIGRLGRGGLLRSHRGASGGYSLARSPKQFTVKDVVSVLEGIPRTSCALSPNGECPIQARCRIGRKVSSLEEAFVESLDRLTIAELAEDIDTLVTTDASP